jgi:hypothetical protein
MEGIMAPERSAGARVAREQTLFDFSFIKPFASVKPWSETPSCFALGGTLGHRDDKHDNPLSSFGAQVVKPAD